MGAQAVLRRADGNSVRVLVVDDESTLSELLAMALRYEGREVRTAADGLSAVRAARDFRPDTVSEGLPPPPDIFVGPFQRPGSLGAIIRGGVVERADASSRGGATALPPADGAVLAGVAPDGPPVTVDLSVGPYRVVATSANGRVYVIGQSVSEAQDVVDGLVLIEVVVIGLALVGAGVVGAVLVRRELRPLERVAQTAASVGMMELDRGAALPPATVLRASAPGRMPPPPAVPGRAGRATSGSGRRWRACWRRRTPAGRPPPSARWAPHRSSSPRARP